MLDPYVQLNELDGYPWTPELRETDEKEEELKDKIPEILFKEIVPPKTLAQQHASANEINFSPNPERDWRQISKKKEMKNLTIVKQFEKRRKEKKHFHWV